MVSVQVPLRSHASMHYAGQLVSISHENDIAFRRESKTAENIYNLLLERNLIFLTHFCDFSRSQVFTPVRIYLLIAKVPTKVSYNCIQFVGTRETNWDKPEDWYGRHTLDIEGAYLHMSGVTFGS